MTHAARAVGSGADQWAGRWHGMAHGPTSQAGLFALSGALLVGGFLGHFVVTLFHPSGNEDTHETIFAEYASSDAWIAIHIGQFVGVIVALTGLLVLSRGLRMTGEQPLVTRFAVSATILTAALWAVLQALDGVALKHAVDAWAEASGSEEATRFANAETLRWLEWGLQSYFRMALGLTFVLFGASMLSGQLSGRWLGWVAILAGLISVANGIGVGYAGLHSSLGDAADGGFALVAVVFAVGLLLTGLRGGRTSRGD